MSAAITQLRAMGITYLSFENQSFDPSLIKSSKYNCFFQTWYNSTIIDDVLNDLLQVPADRVNDLFRHDVVDVTRQMIQNKIDQLYPRVLGDYAANNLTSLKTHVRQFEGLLEDLDRILATNAAFLLGKWLESSKAIATNRLEAANYEFNARNQITTWGPAGQIVDYAMKQWAGMVVDYCLPRWKLFFNELELSVAAHKRINMNKCRQKMFKVVEEPFSTDNKHYPIEADGNSLAVAKVIYDKWSVSSGP